MLKSFITALIAQDHKCYVCKRDMPDGATGARPMFVNPMTGDELVAAHPGCKHSYYLELATALAE